MILLSNNLQITSFYSLFKTDLNRTKYNLLSKNSSFSLVFIQRVEINPIILKIICNNHYGEFKAILFHYIFYIYYLRKKNDNIKYLCKIDHLGKIYNLSEYVSELFLKNECKGSSNNHYYFCTLENCGKELLEFCLKKNNTLKESLEIMIQCSKAIQLFHNLKYVHMDVKLENFLFNKGTIKIIDFGMITEVGTKGKTGNGTIAYKCFSSLYPLQRNASKETYNIIRYFDIYSLACVFIQLLFHKKINMFALIHWLMGLDCKKETMYDNLNKVNPFEINKKLKEFFFGNLKGLYGIPEHEKICDILDLIIDMLNPCLKDSDGVEYYPSFNYYPFIKDENIEREINIQLIINELEFILNDNKFGINSAEINGKGNVNKNGIMIGINSKELKNNGNRNIFGKNINENMNHKRRKINY